MRVFVGLDVQLMCVADINAAAVTLFATDWGADPYFASWQYSISAGVGGNPPAIAAPEGSGDGFDASSPAPDKSNKSLWYVPTESSFCPKVTEWGEEFSKTCAKEDVARCFNVLCGDEGSSPPLLPPSLLSPLGGTTTASVVCAPPSCELAFLTLVFTRSLCTMHIVILIF